MPMHTHSPKTGPAKSVLASSIRESLADSDDRDLTWGGDDRTPDLGAPQRNQTSDQTSDQTPDQRSESWRASFEPATASAMAIQKGWLAEELSSAGTLLQPRSWGGAGGAAGWLTPGGLAGLFCEGGNIAPIWNRANGADTAVVALTWVDEYQGIFTRADGDIRDLAGLKGARLGLPLVRSRSGFPGAVALRGLLAGLGTVGLRHQQVSFVDCGGDSDARYGGRVDDEADEGDQIEALLSGRVDAIFLRARSGARAAWNPRLRELIDLNQTMDPLARVNSATLRPLVVDRSFLDSHRDVVVRYLTVLLRTATWAEHHHDEVVRLLSTEAGGLDAVDVVDAYGPDVHRGFTPALTRSYVGALENQKNFLRDWRFLPADFSVANWVVADPLAEAQERVRKLPPLVDAQDR
jgi:sulfonate transport system substrate-binding protein